MALLRSSASSRICTAPCVWRTRRTHDSLNTSHTLRQSLASTFIVFTYSSRVPEWLREKLSLSSQPLHPPTMIYNPRSVSKQWNPLSRSTPRAISWLQLGRSVSLSRLISISCVRYLLCSKRCWDHRWVFETANMLLEVDKATSLWKAWQAMTQQTHSGFQRTTLLRQPICFV